MSEPEGRRLSVWEDECQGVKALGDIMAEMAQDIGDMMGPDAVTSAHRLQRMVYFTLLYY